MNLKSVSTSPKHLIGALVAGIIVLAIGDVVDWDGPDLTWNNATNSYEAPVTLTLGTGCDCNDPQSGNYNAANNACTAQSFSVAFDTPDDSDVPNKAYSFSVSFNSGGQDAYCGTHADGSIYIMPGDGQSDVTITSVSSTGGDGFSLALPAGYCGGPAIPSATYPTTSASENINPQEHGIGSGHRLYRENNVSFNPPIYDAARNVAGDINDGNGRTYTQDTSLTLAILDNALQGPPGTSCGAGTEGEKIGAYFHISIYNSTLVDGHNYIRPSLPSTVKEPLAITAFDFSNFPSRSDLSGPASVNEIKKAYLYNSSVLSLGAPGGAVSEGGRAYRPPTMADDYGTGAATDFWKRVFQLSSDDLTFDQKKYAVYAMIAYGRDVFDAIYSCVGQTCTKVRGYVNGAGQYTGPFAYAVFFATFANDSKYRTATASEATSTFYLPAEYYAFKTTGPNGLIYGDPQIWTDTLGVKTTMELYWNTLADPFSTTPGTENCSYHSPLPCTDSSNFALRPVGVIDTFPDPYGYHDGPPAKPGTGYYNVVAGTTWYLAVWAGLLPQAETAINYQALYSYVNRAAGAGGQTVLTQPDPCAPPDSRDLDGSRDYYGGWIDSTPTSVAEVTWGPNPNAPFTQCVLCNEACTNNGDNTYTCAPILAGHPAYIANCIGRYKDAVNEFTIGYSGGYRSVQGDSLVPIVVPPLIQ